MQRLLDCSRVQLRATIMKGPGVPWKRQPNERLLSSSTLGDEMKDVEPSQRALAGRSVCPCLPLVYDALL